MKTYKFKLKIYHCPYVIIVGEDYDKIRSEIGKWHDNSDFWHDLENQRGCFFAKKHYLPIVWIRRKPKSAEDCAVFAHECLHLVNWILISYIGIPHTLDSEEAFAHLLRYVIEEGLNKIK